MSEKVKKAAVVIVNGAGEEMAGETPLKRLLEPAVFKIFRFAPGFETAADVNQADDAALLALDGIGPTRLTRLRQLCGPPEEVENDG